jgi:hypothetical protein
MYSFLHGSIIENDFMGRPHVDLEEKHEPRGTTSLYPEPNGEMRHEAKLIALEVVG